MRIAFLQSEWVDHYGIMCLSAALKKRGHEVRVFIERAQSGFLAAVASYRPQLVGFRCVAYNCPWVEKMATQVKKSLGVPVIVGGIHPTLNPSMIEHPAIDFICRGEGEFPLAELADAMERGDDFTGIPNLWVKCGDTVHENEMRPLIQDLDLVYPPDRALYMEAYDFFRVYPWKNVSASRGCPFSCTYCYNGALKEQVKGKGRYVRWRSPQNMIDEMLLLKEKYGARTLHFSDDTFVLPHPWFHEFLREYRRQVRLPFICNARADVLTDDLAAALQEAGCHAVFFGLETGNEDLRMRLLDKRITNRQIERTADILHRRGIRFQTYNMFGLPGETFAQALETLDLNIRIRTDYPSAYIFQPYPGLELTKYALEHGYLEEDSSGEGGAFFGDNALRNPDHARLTNLQQLFYVGVRFPFLAPLVRRLCSLPPNPLFFFIFLVTFGFRYMGSHRVGFFDALYGAWHKGDIFRPQGGGPVPGQAHAPCERLPEAP